MYGGVNGLPVASVPATSFPPSGDHDTGEPAAKKCGSPPSGRISQMPVRRSKAIHRPSGDQIGPEPPWIRRVIDPSATDSVQMLTCAEEPKVSKTIFVPSGDQSGPEHCGLQCVSCRMPVPSAFITNTCKVPLGSKPFSSLTVNAILVPSREMLGTPSMNVENPDVGRGSRI